jgi:hypothetical protein
VCKPSIECVREIVGHGVQVQAIKNGIGQRNSSDTQIYRGMPHVTLASKNMHVLHPRKPRAPWSEKDVEGVGPRIVIRARNFIKPRRRGWESNGENTHKYRIIAKGPAGGQVVWPPHEPWKASASSW